MILRQILEDGGLYSGWGCSMHRWANLDRHLKQNDRLQAAEVDLKSVNLLLMQNNLEEARAKIKKSEYSGLGCDHKFLFDLLLLL